jgi:putative sterol carrier protein
LIPQFIDVRFDCSKCEVVRFTYQLTRDPERALLHQVNANECTLLIERWMSQDCQDAVMAFMAEQMAKQKQKKQAKSSASASTPAAASAAPASFQSAAVFEQLSKRIVNEGASMVKKVDCVYRFDLTNSQNAQCSWLLNLKTAPGSVKQCTSSDAADCVVAMKDADFVQLMSGKLNAQQAFMRGQLKIKGNMMLAQKLSVLSAPSGKL